MRVRRSAARGALVASFAVLLGMTAVAAATPPGRPGPQLAPPRPIALDAAPAAAVAWPPSSGLLIEEVVTGGTSASDEYVEIENRGPDTADLAGLELAYVTSSGSTVSRKVTWATSRPLPAGRRLLVANAAGVFAAQADATYSTGIAATGGSLVLRLVGGSPIDAVGWGDATNAFVEGTAAPAPPAK